MDRHPHVSLLDLPNFQHLVYNILCERPAYFYVFLVLYFNTSFQHVTYIPGAASNNPNKICSGVSRNIVTPNGETAFPILARVQCLFVVYAYIRL